MKKFFENHIYRSFYMKKFWTRIAKICERFLKNIK